tara:strand:+ start:574 stop:900 length:327 start_codon:yes stop_codon:yes gene_type:complete
MVLSNYGRELLSRNKVEEDVEVVITPRPIQKKQETFTREECEAMIEFAINQHNRNAGLISMALGFAFIALFADGLFRTLGLIPPFMGIDVSIVQDVVDKLKDELLNQM